jgi:diadenosine tetraphosphate (Ap4A) HIT family hydrolase
MNMSEFKLHPQLAADTVDIGEFALSLVLMSKDANYPWFILVPKRAEVSEIHQLDELDRQLLLKESCDLAEALEKAFQADKINVAALGNMVPQLHIHHVVRYKNDAAWPAPIWGAVPSIAYQTDQIQHRVETLLACLSSETFQLKV